VSLHRDSNDNGVRIVNFATSNNLVVKSTIFPQKNILKYTWSSPDGKIHNQIDHILIDRRWHSSILDFRPFRGADYDTDHSPVAAKVRERLVVNKQVAQKFEVQRFNRRKLSELQVRKEYQIKKSNTSAILENLSDSWDINRAWENIREDIETSDKKNLRLYEFKQHKPWFDEECLQFLDKRKLVKMQCLQDPNQSNVDNVKKCKT